MISNSKTCKFCSKGSIHLTFYNGSPLLEVRYDGVIVTTFIFPDSESGLKFAKRVFNGLQ